jgi:hypothetical protein
VLDDGVLVLDGGDISDLPGGGELRAAERGVGAGAELHLAPVGRDRHMLRIGVQRRADDLLADVGTVEAGGVDEGDPQLDRAPP